MDKMFFPVCGLLLLFIAHIPELLEVGDPGIGSFQLIISGFGLSLCAVPFVSTSRPWSWIKARAEKHGIGRKELLLVGLSFVVALIVFDLALNLILPPSYQRTEFGWSVRANREVQQNVQDTLGKYRSVTNKYFENGFKRWGTLENKGRRWLVVGDSMTQMVYVSNGEEWYAYLERANYDASFFVFGGGGYGSLQEFLVLDKHYDQIKPDYILWQFCSNDYPNNSYELDRMGYPYNNHAVRPYLESDEIVFRLPLPLPFLRRLSFVADRTLAIYDKGRLKAVTANRDAFEAKRKKEKQTWSDEKKHEIELIHHKAFEVTRRIMAKVRERVSTTPVYLVNLCGRLTEKEKIICEEQRFECIEGVIEHAAAMAKEGQEIRVANDAHWNRKGNQIIGEWLVRYFNNKGIF